MGFAWFGRQLAQYLSTRRHVHIASSVAGSARLLAILQPGDVLLVEGDSRVSAAIKYLTQSTWSHAALFVGDSLPANGAHKGHCFIEADLLEGVRGVGAEEFDGFHTRICRPIGIDKEKIKAVCQFAIDRLGYQYDMTNIIDLARYLFPLPPVPARFRRRMLALGSGDPSRVICSTLIAQAFESIQYPILPIVDVKSIDTPDCPGCVQEILHIRHYSLYTPRDFDVSNYFQIINPAHAVGFDYRLLKWGHTGSP